MSVLDPIRIEIVDFEGKETEIEYPLHPADETHGTQKIHFSKVNYIEASSFLNANADDKWVGLALD